MTTAVVIPLRSVVLGKERLGAALPDDARAALAGDMALAVVGAAGDRPTVIVSSAPEVVGTAEQLAITCIADPGTLDRAADAGREWARAHGYERVIIAHADLPLATSFDVVDGDGASAVAVIVPDHRDDGTPVLSIPAASEFVFAYGPGSAARHIAEAERCGLAVRIVRDAALAFDVDTPDDLARLAAHRESRVQ
jgi:2-phospho-L-lactate guanylyltransferase